MEGIIDNLKNELKECRSIIETQASTIESLQSLSRTLTSSMNDLTKQMSFSKMSMSYQTRRAMRDRHSDLIGSAVEANTHNVKYVKTLQSELASDKTDLAS
jgi:hypothetical protein